MIKKIISVLLALLMLITVFCGCSDDTTDTEKLDIVCTVFPYYDWVRSIVGENENVNVTLLLDSGTDLHSYQPTAADIITISSADIFIYTGGTSDSWAKDVLMSSKNEKTVVLELMANLPEDELYCVEAIGEDEHHHEEGDAHNHTHDEHIWLSLKNAMKLSEIIKNVLQDLDAENKDTYQENFIKFRSDLEKLDDNYKNTFAGCSKNTLVFADRFPFIYLTKDYSLNYHAAFSGCSAESEASFETVTRLAGEIDKLGLSHIVITETADGSVANTVKNATKDKNQTILTLNSLQSVTKDKLSLSYIMVMEDNLAVLKEALS